MLDDIPAFFGDDAVESLRSPFVGDSQEDGSVGPQFPSQDDDSMDVLEGLSNCNLLSSQESDPGNGGKFSQESVASDPGAFAGRNRMPPTPMPKNDLVVEISSKQTYRDPLEKVRSQKAEIAGGQKKRARKGARNAD